MSSAQTMKIYSIISRIEDELEDSPKTKFAGAANKRIVEIDRLFDLLGDLKVTIPEDIRRATGILAEAENTIRDAQENADEIVASAQQEADQILQQAQANAESIYRQAQVEYEQRVSESEVYKEAIARANSISDEAETNANAIYNGARKYADDILLDLQTYLSDYHKMIADNRKELSDTPEEIKETALVSEPEKTFDDKFVPAAQHYDDYKAAPDSGDTVMFNRNDFKNVPIHEADPEGQDEDGYFPEPPVGNKPQNNYAFDDFDDYDDDDDFDEQEVKPKKKNIFQRMFEVEDYDEDEDEEEEEEKPAPKKRKSSSKSKKR